MSDYVVSARKYRPASFDAVVGQEALTVTLRNAVKAGKLAHAYLFCGPRGVGKTTCARIFAKAINCLHPKEDGEACEECESCKAFNEQRSLNIHELDAASNNSVDDIRALIEKVRVPPQLGRYKVFIIDEVHMLSAGAFNAFLKTLEEPPAYVVFILATTEKHKILPTILSRCQIYDFRRIGVQTIVDYLQLVADKEGYTCEPAALNLIARKADGGMRDALSIFDQVVSFCGGNLTYKAVAENLNELDEAYYFRMVELSLRGDACGCLLLFNEILQKGFEAGQFIGGLAAYIRDLLVSSRTSTLCLLETSADIQAQYAAQAASCTPVKLFQALRICNDCHQNYRMGKNKRLQVEIALILIAQTLNTNSNTSKPSPDIIERHVINPLFSPTKVQQNVPSSSKEVSSPFPKEEKKQKLKRMESLGSSILETHEASTAEHQATKAATFGRPKIALNKENLTTAYDSFICTLPQDETANAQRLRGIPPKHIDDDTFEITVENEIVRQAMGKLLPQMLAFFRKRFYNPSLNITVSVSDQKEKRRFKSKAEIFNELVQHNASFRILSEKLDLELE